MCPTWASGVPVKEMAHNLQLVEDGNLAVIIYRDTVAASEIEGVFDSLQALAQGYPGLGAIADFRNCNLAFSTEELRSLAQFSRNAAHAAGPAKWAILAGDDLTFGLGRMFSAFASDQPVETRTFRDVADVAAWFGLKADSVKDWLNAAAKEAGAD